MKFGCSKEQGVCEVVEIGCAEGESCEEGSEGELGKSGGPQAAAGG